MAEGGSWPKLTCRNSAIMSCGWLTEKGPTGCRLPVELSSVPIALMLALGPQGRTAPGCPLVTRIVRRISCCGVAVDTAAPWNALHLNFDGAVVDVLKRRGVYFGSWPEADYIRVCQNVCC